MGKRQVIKSKFIPAQPPTLGTIVAWLLYRELNLTGVAAGVYITIAATILGLAWVFCLAQIWTTEPLDPVFKEEK